LENIKIGNKIIFLFLVFFVSCQTDNINSNVQLYTINGNEIICEPILISQNKIKDSVYYVSFHKLSDTLARHDFIINLNTNSYYIYGKDSFNLTQIGVEKYIINQYSVKFSTK
jgi:hypothetical protein